MKLRTSITCRNVCLSLLVCVDFMYTHHNWSLVYVCMPRCNVCIHKSSVEWNASAQTKPILWIHHAQQHDIIFSFHRSLRLLPLSLSPSISSQWFYIRFIFLFRFISWLLLLLYIFLLLLNNKYALIFCLAGCKWKFPIINLHASDLLKTNGQFHCIGHKRKYFAAPVLLASHDFQLVGQFQCVSGIYFFLYFFLNFSLLVEP